MLKILLLLMLTSCMKMNFSTEEKSGKNGSKSSSSSSSSSSTSSPSTSPKDMGFCESFVKATRATGYDPTGRSLSSSGSKQGSRSSDSVCRDSFHGYHAGDLAL